jgi:molybdopterin converting factor subunit 1
MRVLFFAHLRDVTHQADMILPVAGMVDADGVWQAIVAEFPDLAHFRSSVRLARNGEYTGPDAWFTDSDEVALIPPVSGG